MAVPVLDDAYMLQRQQERERRRQIDYWAAWARITERGPDTPELLREDYAAGRIDFEELNRRLDRII